MADKRIPVEMTEEEMAQRAQEAADVLGPEELARLKAEAAAQGQAVSNEPCRVIQLKDLQSTGRWDHGRPVTLEEPSGITASVSEVLTKLMPDKRVECLGRTTTQKFWEYNLSPSSVFFQTVHFCFQKHHALTLRPEVLMHQIVSEVAATVKRHPEEYRHLFTGSPEKVRIDVRHDGLVLGNPESPWHEVLAMFGGKLAKTVPPGIMDHLLPPLSTHTVESWAASTAAFMAAASPFYDFHTHTMCGIPEIRLAGEPEDYRLMVNAAAQLAEVFKVHLGRYFTHLLPVLKTLAEQADGAPQADRFWKSIYQFESESGKDIFNGWISAFVNYVQTAEVEGNKYQQARTGELVQKPDDAYDWQNPGEGWDMKGLHLGSVPSQVCVAPFTWHYLDRPEMKMLFAGGPLAVEEVGGSLMPVLSYAILHDE